MDISGSELPNNVGGNGVEGNGQKKFVGRHDVQQNSSSKQSGQLEKNKEDFVGMISVQEREAECLDKKSEEMCGNVCKTQQMLQQELEAIEQGFNELLQQEITKDDLRELTNKLQAIKAQGQEIEQAIDALSRLGNVPQDQIKVLRGQLGYIDDRCQALIHLGRYLNNSQSLRQVLEAIEKEINGLLQQELNEICQEFDVLLQQGTENDGLLVLVNKAQVLSNRLQALDTRGQKIEQAIDALSRLGNVPQDQINALHGQLVNIAQRYHALDQLARCFEMQQELNAIKQGFNKLLQQEITEDGLRELTNKLQVLEDREQELKQAINVLSRLGNVPQDQIKVLHGQLVNIAQECQALIHLGQYLNNPNQLQQELEAIKHGFNRLLQHGLPAYDVEILNQRFSMLEDREQELEKAINALSRLDNVPQGQINALRNQLIDIALTAVKWRIAPLFKQEGKFASVSNWWSGVNSVQKEVDRLGEKLNSGQEVTQEELQNLLKQMHKLFPDSVGNSLLDRAVKALTAVSAVGAVASGAAAVGTSMTCASIGNAFAGCETACTTLLGMSPVGCGVVAVGLGATAIGGAIYLSRKK